MSFRPLPQQRRAIEAPLGPVLVVAGPGAGKTFCLIGRIRYLIQKLDFKPERICAVTFTNKAAEEIATRLHDVLGAAVADAVRRGTIHALCAEILREHAEAAGLKPGFGIADDDYQRTVLRQLGQGRRDRQLIALFGRRRLQDYQLTSGDERLFRDYIVRLRRRNLVDFDDLVVLTGELFRKRPEIADAVAARWDYVLVDEFQDVNAAQYAILKRLAERHGNIFVVGDDEQSIFAWTGADPRVLARFQRELGVAEPILLDRNHRSARQIFETARRLLAENPSLFDKQLDAPRESEHQVRAVAFAADEDEAAWLLADVAADRGAHGLRWGDYAVLYRRHDIGDRLETRLLRAGIPCRLAKGRPLTEDRVIGYVIAALRLVRDPRDAVAAESFAAKVLPPHLLERVQADTAGGDFLLAVRDVAGALGKDPDAKKLWRLIYQVENLVALPRKHASLWGLVEDLLSQRIGPYLNKLEERHEDLVDPADVPAAVALSARLAAAERARARLVLPRLGGLEIALRGLLQNAGMRRVAYEHEVTQAELDDVRVGTEDAGAEGLAYTVFKALQLVQAKDVGSAFERYVAFDLETTGLDTSSCEIVDIAALRVERGAVVDTFHRLVRPTGAVAAGARDTHGYADEELAAAPPFSEVWPGFRAFVGADTLVAHNGQDFDVPVLRRLAAGEADELAVFDTLPLARSLYPGGAGLAALAERFGIDAGRAHRALDDTQTLVRVYEELERRRVVRARKSVLVGQLAWVGLAFALDGARRDTDEVKLLFEDIARFYTLGRYSDALDVYEAERVRAGLTGPAREELVRRLGGPALLERLRAERDVAQRFPNAVARLQGLVDQGPGEPLAAALDRFLERVALSTSQGAEVDEQRVNLLTLHSTKGLEFSRVYVVGVEDEQLPGWSNPEEDREAHLQESRRLLYVGMTRAIDRLVLTRADRRAGRPGGGSRFLDEMGLVPERPEAAAMVQAAEPTPPLSDERQAEIEFDG
jgi:DNA polymerase III epsilon subunit family exonuclease